MDFAKKILYKYGWNEGEGLGKSVVGAVKPVKASFKFDNAGLGVDPASEFNNFWWDRVFNEASQNLEIRQQEGSTVTIDLKNHDDSVEISTREYSTKKLKRAKQKKGDLGYGNFIHSSVLTEAGKETENSERIVAEDITVRHFKTPTDDELFRACGGRTKMSGKLLRLEIQEKELLAKMQTENEAEELPIKKKLRSKQELKPHSSMEKRKKTEYPEKNINEVIPSKSLKKKKSKSDVSSSDANDQQLVQPLWETSISRKEKIKLTEANPLKKNNLNKNQEQEKKTDPSTIIQEKEPLKMSKRKKIEKDEFTHKKCKKSKKEKI